MLVVYYCGDMVRTTVVLLILWICCVFFFFKQKTAYEMRISDWSSDVCSSDLVEEIVAVMDGLISALASINVSARKMDPTDLIGWVDDITSPTTAAGEDVVNYNPLDPIADQAVRRDVEL